MKTEFEINSIGGGKQNGLTWVKSPLIYKQHHLLSQLSKNYLKIGIGRGPVWNRTLC